MYKFTQRSWAGGRLDEELMGRQDLTKYYTGASELINFDIKRQGNLSKRYGTTLAARLENLLGTHDGATNPIDKIRLIPVVREKSDGYYLLFTAKKAFVLSSKEGIRLMDGSFAPAVLPYDADEAGDYNPDMDPGEEYSGPLPFFIGKNGYDSLSAAIAAAIPGDTIKLNGAPEFDSIKSYPAGSIVRHDGKTWQTSTARSAGDWNDADWTEVPDRVMSSSETAVITYTSSMPVTLDLNGYRLEMVNTSSTAEPLSISAGEFNIINSGATTIPNGNTTLRAAITHYNSSHNSAIIKIAANTTLRVSNHAAVENRYRSGTTTIRTQPAITSGSSTSGAPKIYIDNAYLQTEGVVINLYANNHGAYIEKTTVQSRNAAVGSIFTGGNASSYNYTTPVIETEGGISTFKFDGGEPESDAILSSDAQAAPDPLPSYPYYINIPYEDADLASVDFTQSGDTIFLTHRSFPPIAIVVQSDGGLAKRIIDFGSTRYHRPVITSVTGSGTEGNGSEKTIYYCCTYVKDGIESLPSLDYGFTYKLPWANTFKVTITCSKGANSEEPDYYNIYKKDASGFGLIATAGKSGKVKLECTATGSFTPGEESPYTARDSFINTSDIPIAYKHGNLTWGTGGFDSGLGGVSVDCRDASTIFTKVSLQLDNLKWHQNGNYATYCVTGTHFRAILNTADPNGTNDKYFTVEVDVTAADKPIGQNTISYSGGVPAPESFKSRTVTFDFYTLLTGAYQGLANYKPVCKVKGLIIEAYDNAQNKNRVVLYWHGLSFESAYGRNDSFDDEYITPDMSNTPPRTMGHFDKSGDYPGAVAIYQQRLAYASSANDPFTLWLSATGDLYNFTPHESIREDDAMEITLAATEFPSINHIIESRDLMLFCDSGEWKVAPVSGNTLSYKTISAKLQSAIGCVKSLKPIRIGDELIFATSSAQSLMATKYNWSSDGYESQDLSVLSQWLFKNNPIISMAYRQYPDSTIYAVLQDGSVAALVYMPEQEVCAWSRIQLGGSWQAKAIATNKSESNGSTDIAIIVERNGEYALWRLNDIVPIRSGRPNAAPHICLDAMHILAAGEELAEDETVISTGTETYAGHLYTATLVSVRPEAQGSQTIQFEIKNAKDAEVRLLQSGSFTINAYRAKESLSQFVDTKGGIVDLTDGTLALSTIDVKRLLPGVNIPDGRIIIESTTPWPLTILSLSVNYEIQPLSGAPG